MIRRLLASLTVTALAFTLAVQAADPIRINSPKPADTKIGTPDLTDAQIAQQQKEAAIKQDQLKRQFDEFKQSLLRLAHRLESTGKSEDKDKAAILKKAISVASEQAVDTKFTSLVAALKNSDSFKQIDKLGELMTQNEDLRLDIKKLIELLLSDDRDTALTKERMETEKLLERIKEIIAKQERARAMTEQSKKAKEDLARDQSKVTKETKDLLGPKDDKNKNDPDKKGEAKQGGNDKDYAKGEAKYDAKDPKAEERKPDAGKEGKETPGEAKEAKPSENKEESKPGEPKEAKPGDNKESKPGENKEAKPGENKEAKPGDSKEGKPGDGKEGKPGENKEGKPGENKEGKPGDGKEGKPGDGKEGKPGDGKEGKPGDGKEGKPGDGKEGQPGEGKEGKPGDGKEGKPGEGKEGKPGSGKEGKPGEGKEGKPGAGKESKPGSGDNKPGENKESKPGSGDSKPGQNKEGKPGAGDNKPGTPKEGKPGAGQPGEPKEGKPGSGQPGKPGQPGEKKEGKPGAGEGKPGSGKEGKPGEAKSGSDSKGRGEGKAEAKKGGESKPGPMGSPSPGKPGEGKPGEGKPGQGQPGQGKPSSGGGKAGQQLPGPPPEAIPIKKQIQDSNKYQESAEDNIKKDDNKKASDDQDEAIKKLEEARRKLEELLKQLREEEIERLLAKLQGRCERMLALQIIVRDGTVIVDKEMKAKPQTEVEQRASAQASNDLAIKEDEIVREANLAIRLIEAEGSAIAFAEVFKQVRGDMVTVASRLRKTDVAVVTQTIENDIIDTLQEMIAALKKARQDNQSKPKPSKPGQQGPPPDQKLIDLIAELKMIRSMQERVNKRTETYGREYKGEQAPAPATAKTDKEREQLEMVTKELKDLAARQEKISKVTGDIAKGKNKAN